MKFQVFDIGKGSDTPITGIEFRKTGYANKYFIFVTTAERLYQFMGYANYEDKTLLQPIFNAYLNVPEKGYMKKSSALNYSRLQFFCDKSTTTPMSFGWLIENSIYHGQVIFRFEWLHVFDELFTLSLLSARFGGSRQIKFHDYRWKKHPLSIV